MSDALKSAAAPKAEELMRDPLALMRWYARVGVTLPRPLQGVPLTEQRVDSLANLFALPDASQVLGTLACGPQGQERLLEVLNKREMGIELMRNDPLSHGYEPQWWKDARSLLYGGKIRKKTEGNEETIEVEAHDELLILGGNDSMKSWLLAKLGVEILWKEKDAEYVFGHNTEASSINQQQKIVYRFLPPGWRDLKKKGNADVTFTPHGGFKENKFVLPNGARGYFFFWRQQPGDLAGYKARGLSGDELITMGHVEELRARMLGKGGKLVIGFTPIYGYTPVVGDYVAGADVMVSRPSKFLPNRNFPNDPTIPEGHMPYILQCRRKSAAIICAFTEWSPFRAVGELEKLIDNRPRSFVMIRAYGWAEKPVGNAIPKFSKAVNVVKRNRHHPWNGNGVVPPSPWGPIKTSKEARREGGQDLTPGVILYPRLPRVGTNYQVVDPAGGAKNYVSKWYRVGARPEWNFVYREWPPMSTYGPWAEMTRPMSTAGEGRVRYDGYPGPAQRFEYGRSIAGYKKVFLEAEGWVWDEEAGVWDGSNAEPIFERYMDSRMGGAQVPSEDQERTSIIQMFENEQFDERGRLIGPAMYFLPSHVTGGRSVANSRSLELLNDKFDYNTDEPVTVLNCPKWFVVDACEQSILAYQEYTGADGETGALKDLMDPDWYFVNADCKHVTPETFVSTGGGSY